ncbi:hypothetical protein ACOQFO_01470 [Ureibacillus sp. MALMAid1270]
MIVQDAVDEIDLDRYQEITMDGILKRADHLEELANGLNNHVKQFQV